MNNSSRAIEENNVDREAHTQHVHAVAGNDPEPAISGRPVGSFSQQANQTRKISVRDRDLRGEQRIARAVAQAHASFQRGDRVPIETRIGVGVRGKWRFVILIHAGCDAK